MLHLNLRNRIELLDAGISAMGRHGRKFFGPTVHANWTVQRPATSTMRRLCITWVASRYHR